MNEHPDKAQKNMLRVWQAQAKPAIIAMYEAAFAQYGYDVRSIFWPKGRQRIRFRVLAELGLQNGDHVLDVGCGLGHFCEFLRRENIRVHYTGIDIVESLIHAAQQAHPQGQFRVGDIAGENMAGQWDYAVLSGTCNILSEGFSHEMQWQFVQIMLSRMFAVSAKGVAADFQSTYVDFQQKGAFHVDPEEVFRFCKTLSRRVVLRHDYMPYEFAVYIYKDDELTAENVFRDFAPYVKWYAEEQENRDHATDIA